MTFGAGAALRFAVTTTGIGVGTSAPSTEGMEIVAPSADTSFNLNDQADSMLVLRNADSGSTNTGRFCAIQMKINSSSAAAEGTIRTQFAGDGDADLIFSTTKGGTGYDRMVLDEDGHLAINSGKVFYLDGGSNTYIYENNSDSLGLVTGGTARVFVNNTGLGVGVQPSNYAFQVNGTSYFSGAVTFNGGIKDKDDSLGTNTHVLHTNGSDVYWAAASGGGGSGSGTVTSGSETEVAIYKSDGTTVDGTDELFVDETHNQVTVRNELLINADPASTGLSTSTYPLYVNGNMRATALYDKSSTSWYLKPGSDTDNISAKLAGGLFMYALSSDITAPSGFAGIYTKYSSGVARVFASDGYQITQISPHDNDGNWVFNSTDKKTKKRTRINMTKLIRKIEELTGEEFIIEDFVE